MSDKSQQKPRPAPKGKPELPPHSNVRGAVPSVPEGAPRYRVTGRAHFINGRVVQPGDIVSFTGIPGVSLEPLDDAAKKAREAADADRAKRKDAAEQERQEVARLRKLIGKVS